MTIAQYIKKQSISVFASYNKAKKGQVTFIEQKKNETKEDVTNKLKKTRASYVIVPYGIKTKTNKKYQFIINNKNPKLAFIKLINKIYTPYFSKHNIHPTASVEGIIGKNCYIGAGVVIMKNVIIGDNCIIFPNTVIGGPGFGHVIEKKKQLHFPHIGGVHIGNNVRIGSNTCIDCGTLDNTLIGSNVRIDNLVHIAHNVEIGENSMIVANCMIAGSVKIGKDTWVGPSTSVLNQLSIGDDSYIGMAACVTKSIPSNSLAYGFPAKIKKEDI